MIKTREAKNKTRMSMKQHITSINIDEKNNSVVLLNKEILEQIKVHLNTLINKRIALYIPDKYEVDIKPLIHQLLILKVQVYIPIVTQKGMIFYQINTNMEQIEDNYITNKQLSQFHLILVPLIALTTNNRRIGRGGGHYDRFFANIEKMNIAC